MRTGSKQELSIQTRGGLNYQLYNYCAKCQIEYPTEIMKCTDCNYRVRTTGWHRSKVADKKKLLSYFVFDKGDIQGQKVLMVN